MVGDGILENLPRVLPSGITAVINAETWPVPPVFDWISREGRVSSKEMLRTFNCGIGGVLVVDQHNTDVILKELQHLKENASVIGALKVSCENEPKVLVNGKISVY